MRADVADKRDRALTETIEQITADIADEDEEAPVEADAAEEFVAGVETNPEPFRGRRF